MKLLIALFLMFSTSGAFACSEYLLSRAQASEEIILQMAKVGVGSDTDVLVAERDVLDKQLCMALQDKSIYDDATLLQKLGVNVDARIKLEQTRIDVGIGELSRLALLKGEKASYSAACEEVLEKSRIRIDVGLIGQKQFDAIAKICEALK